MYGRNFEVQRENCNAGVGFGDAFSLDSCSRSPSGSYRSLKRSDRVVETARIERRKSETPHRPVWILESPPIVLVHPFQSGTDAEGPSVQDLAPLSDGNLLTALVLGLRSGSTDSDVHLGDCAAAAGRSREESAWLLLWLRKYGVVEIRAR